MHFIATANLHWLDTDGWAESSQLPAFEFDSLNKAAADRRAHKHYLLEVRKTMPQKVLDIRLYVDVQEV